MLGTPYKFFGLTAQNFLYYIPTTINQTGDTNMDKREARIVLGLITPENRVKNDWLYHDT